MIVQSGVSLWRRLCSLTGALLDDDDDDDDDDVYPPPPVSGFPLQLYNGILAPKARMMGLAGREKSVDTIHEWTDRRTDTGRQLVLRLFYFILHFLV